MCIAGGSLIMNIIWEDLGFFIDGLRHLPVSKSLSLNNKSFCVSTGCSFESWVYYPEKVKNKKDVESLIKFFQEQDISFMWPLYDEGEEILKEAGLVYAGNLTAMSYNPSAFQAPSLKMDGFSLRVSPKHEDWAKTAWRGFGGGFDDIPENYFALVKAFNDDEKFSLYIAEYEGKNAGTFLITHEENLTGVYYFATVPEFRRRGIARAMMNEICRLSGTKTIVLQATPSGLPFYKNFGFDELFSIPVYSTESNIF